jgi:hypothetical protein
MWDHLGEIAVNENFMRSIKLMIKKLADSVEVAVPGSYKISRPLNVENSVKTSVTINFREIFYATELALQL